MYNFPAEKKDDERQQCNLDRVSKEVCSCPLLLQGLCQHVRGTECRATTSVAKEKHNLGRVSELRKFALVLLFSPVAATPVASPAGQHLFTHHTRWASTKVITHGSHGVIASMV